jgi:hypothetical protein
VRSRIHTSLKANMVSAHEFVCGTTATGPQVKRLIVVDEYTPRVLGQRCGQGAIQSKREIWVLSRSVSLHEAPLFMRSGKGPEFAS